MTLNLQNKRSRIFAGVVLLLALGAAHALAQVPTEGGDWTAYGRTALGDRHSPLTQITPENVAGLEVAWRFNTGEADQQTGGDLKLETTPIVFEGVMYLNTPLGQVIALNPSTGQRLWSHHFRVDPDSDYGDFVSRGVSLWRDTAAPPEAPCATRVIVGVIDARLAALDARTGEPCAGFGAGGAVDLTDGLRNAPAPDTEYELTSPPAVIGDRIIVGSAIADNGRVSAASGEVRAYDARSGALLWTFDPVPQDPADPAYDTWVGEQAHDVGGANAWSVIAADPERGLVFVPTGAPSVDYWGGHRLGDNRYANSIVALNAETGAVVWSFQTVHHDIWDYDNAAPPALVDIRREGETIPAVLVATKTGQLFVLHRETGEPLFPVEERPVPASDVPGEVASATQPFSSLPTLSPLTLDQAWGATPEIQAWCQARLDTLRNDGPFTPPSIRGSLILPSNIGGAHWGGVAYDPARGLAIIPTNRVAAIITLVPREAYADSLTTNGERIGVEHNVMRGAPYALRREIFLSPEGGICTPQPLGALVAVDLNAGDIAWSVPLGSADGLPLPGAERLQGMVNLGGAITTASGLTFIAASPDAHLRAFDTATGQELWRGRLPAGARSTPMTYQGPDGRQYVVIAAGGDDDLFGRSDQFVAFALPAAEAGRVDP